MNYNQRFAIATVLGVVIGVSLENLRMKRRVAPIFENHEEVFNDMMEFSHWQQDTMEFMIENLFEMDPEEYLQGIQDRFAFAKVVFPIEQ